MHVDPHGVNNCSFYARLSLLNQGILKKMAFSRVGSFFSTVRIAAVIFLQFDGEHGVVGQPSTWVQVVLVGAVDQVIAEVLSLIAVLGTLLIWPLAVAVHD